MNRLSIHQEESRSETIAAFGLSIFLHLFLLMAIAFFFAESLQASAVELCRGKSDSADNPPSPASNHSATSICLHLTTKKIHKETQKGRPL